MGRFIDPMQGLKRIDDQHRYLRTLDLELLRTSIDTLTALLLGSDGSQQPAVVTGGQGLQPVTDPDSGEITAYEVPQVVLYYQGLFYDNLPADPDQPPVTIPADQVDQDTHIVVILRPDQPSQANGSRGYRRIETTIVHGGTIIVPQGTAAFEIGTPPAADSGSTSVSDTQCPCRCHCRLAHSSSLADQMEDYTPRDTDMPNQAPQNPLSLLQD